MTTKQRFCLLAGVIGQMVFGGGLVSARAAAPAADVRRDAVVQAIEDVMPSVVNISTETLVEIRDPFDQVFRDFFGPSWGRRSIQRQHSLGSGVIIDETGYVLTNFHVVRRASRITVTLSDGRSFQAEAIVGTLKTDVALLRLTDTKGESFKAIKFAPDDDLLLGETVLALGNPFGLGGSVSRGILSSKARRPVTEDEQSLDVKDWLQTDAAINPGNSGGPLVNLRGELIGVSVAVYREGQGIGFAIPIKRVAEALNEIFIPERIRSLWFGGRFESGVNGLITASVEPESPAEKAGLRPGDRILSVGEVKPRNVIELNREVIAAGDRREVRLAVQRDKERRNLVAQLVPMKSVFNAGLIRERLGVSVQILTPDLAAGMGFGQYQGLLVAGIDPSSPAEKAGLHEGDLIQAWDGQAPEKLEDAARLVHRKKSGDKMRLNVIVPRRTGRFVQLFSATRTVTVR